MRKDESVMEYCSQIKRLKIVLWLVTRKKFNANTKVPAMEIMLNGIALESFK